MKKIYLVIICLSILSFFINSCQKSFDEDIQNPTINNTTDDSIYLSKIYSFETDLSGGALDTTNRIYYLYDNLKRLTKSVDTSGLPSDLNKSIFTSQYFYSGNDTLPYRIKETETSFQNNNPIINQDSYFFYNALGQLIKDSSNIGYIILNNYSYSNNIILSSETIIYNSIVHSDSRKDTMVLNTNGNITEIRGRTYYSILNSLINIQSIGFYTYDTYKCPSVDKIGFPKLSFSKKNNLVKYIITKTNLTTNQIEDVFKQDFSVGGSYNTFGYPVIFRDLTPLVVIPNNPPIPYETKNLYFYTTL